ncbi:hypothetical protein KRR39_23705 [Nocardioides panacis]|uniref:Uncharacterized protein n=1 Tax=Nocardioides panacis TaxID=2849501 RepID=A0A975SZJ0_9ACTN|nr:hypothetical protein [Nocardioides panacis]QWZ08280.1 hypothetical protein KRR39_23705 [Nocardioides panacis]
MEVFEAIPERIEVSGHRPTWRVTGGSFEAALDYARDAFGGSAVVAREDRGRWWPRVTLTVTVDPALVAAAPPLGSFDTGEPEPSVPDPDIPLALERMFAHQEERRMARLRIPAQRSHRS